MNQVVVYILIAVVVFLIIFLTVRFILQMVFLRECPNCGRTLSLAVSRECPDCGYVFLKNRHFRLNLTIVLLVTGLAALVVWDIHYFREQTADYLAANPYLWRGEAVESTEMSGVESTEVIGSLPGQEEEEFPNDQPLDEQVPAETTQEESGETGGKNPIAGVLQDLFD